MNFFRMDYRDIDAVFRIEQEAFGAGAWNPVQLRQDLSDPAKHYVCLKDEGGTLTAYGGFWVILDEAHIMNIAVDRNFRRRGLGEALTRFLMEQARCLGARRMTLEAEDTNRAACALYEKLSFVSACIRPHYYGEGRHARIYWRDLIVL